MSALASYNEMNWAPGVQFLLWNVLNSFFICLSFAVLRYSNMMLLWPHQGRLYFLPPPRLCAQRRLIKKLEPQVLAWSYYVDTPLRMTIPTRGNNFNLFSEISKPFKRFTSEFIWMHKLPNMHIYPIPFLQTRQHSVYCLEDNSPDMPELCATRPLSICLFVFALDMLGKKQTCFSEYINSVHFFSKFQIQYML